MNTFVTKIIAKFMKFTITLFLLLFNLLVLNLKNCLAESPTESQKDSSYAGKVVVTATRLEEPIEKVTASVTVITNEDIEKKHRVAK